MLDFFRYIWATRPHYSEISGAPLSENDPLWHWFFAHCLSKGAEPKLKYDPRNIILMTPNEHDFYDNSGMASEDQNFDWVFLWRMKLKRDLYVFNYSIHYKNLPNV